MSLVKQLPTFDREIADIKHGKTRVVIELDKQSLSHVLDRVQEYKSLPRKFKPALEGIADYVREEMIPETFSKEGPGWKPLARRTQFDRRMQGYGAKHPILKRTGDLYKELTQKAHPKHIEVIRVGKYARVELGGSSKKFIENQMGNGKQRLPARPMIPGTDGMRISDRDRLAIENIIRKAITKGK